jgi:hypothetical protein
MGFQRVHVQQSKERCLESRSEDEQDDSEFFECRRRSSSRLSSALGLRRRIGQRYAHGGAFWNVDGLRIVRCFDRQRALPCEQDGGIRVFEVKHAKGGWIFGTYGGIAESGFKGIVWPSQERNTTMQNRELDA